MSDQTTFEGKIGRRSNPKTESKLGSSFNVVTVRLMEYVHADL